MNSENTDLTCVLCLPLTLSMASPTYRGLPKVHRNMEFEDVCFCAKRIKIVYMRGLPKVYRCVLIKKKKLNLCIGISGFSAPKST